MTHAPPSAPASTPGRAARAAEQLVTRALGLPAARTGYRRIEERTPTRDGARLMADHYAPDTEHPLGTVLIRTPYGRGGVSSLTSARMLAARGYHVLVQSCRGTHDSEGLFDPMVADAADAQDTVAWLREQSWFDGRLATAGGSYLGWTQWALMADPPPELRAAIVLVGPHDFAEVVYGSGTFSLNDFLSWADVIVHQEDGGGVHQIVRALSGPRRLASVFAGLPLGDAAEAALKGKAPWYRRWVAHPDRTDPFWEPRRANGALDEIDIPVLLVGGWQDLFIPQTMQQYAALHARGADVALTVGPWVHLDLAGKGAGIVARETLGWLDENLAGATGRTRPAPVRIYVTGAGQWRDLPEWPPPTTTTTRWLRPHGALGREAPTGPSPVATFRYDPADPTPTVGGRLLTQAAGVRDNRKLESRGDVVTFTTEPLAAALEVIGVPVVELEHSTDNPHADVFVRLCDVDAKGRSHNFSDTLLRLDPTHPADTPQVLRLELDPCAHRIAAGHRLRLQVSGGSHPRFARNTGTDEPPVTATTLVGSAATVHGGRVELPTM